MEAEWRPDHTRRRSWVAELSPGSMRHWVTATAAPCTSLFKPVRVDDPLDLGPNPTDTFDPRTLWWRHERLHRRAVMHPIGLYPLFTAERDTVERRWIADPPEPRSAFDQGDRLLRAGPTWCSVIRPIPAPGTYAATGRFATSEPGWPDSVLASISDSSCTAVSSGLRDELVESLARCPIRASFWVVCSTVLRSRRVRLGCRRRGRCLWGATGGRGRSSPLLPLCHGEWGSQK